MAYLQDLVKQEQQLTAQQQTYAAQTLGLASGQAYSSFYPAWEINTPQYVTPSPYSLAQQGYRTNEVAFAAIGLRADAISEAPLWVWRDDPDTPEEQDDHGIRELLKNNTCGISEQQYWHIVETYLQIAGFSAWEKERNNLGEVIGLWPMRPDWCSFLRGHGKPIRAIRYQPYGLPYMDIDIDNIVMFSYFDPLYPLLKPYSPTMAALNMLEVDNNTTQIINAYMKNGGFLSGVLTTDQMLQDTEAQRIRDKWRESHGGAKNAGDIAVLGKGAKYEGASMNFREMVFPELDARSEARLTMIYKVPPILLGTKLGLDRSTYSNYAEARKAFYEGPISHEWRFLETTMSRQLLPDFEAVPAKFYCEFSTAKVRALQDDQTESVNRAGSAYNSGLATLNEGREMAGLDPDEDEERGKKYKSEIGQEMAQDNIELGIGAKPDEEERKEPTDEEREEEKNFRAFAKRRIKEGKFADIPEFEFKHVRPARARQLVADYQAAIVIEALRKDKE